MDLFTTIKDLIQFRTETGNAAEIEKCLSYIEDNLLNAGALVKIFHFSDASPVLFASNQDTNNYDILIVGHIDVVPAADSLFFPQERENRLYGRGTLDMKSFVAVALNSLHYALKRLPQLNIGIILSSDEEMGSKSLEAFLKVHPNLKAKIVLDNDVGGDITKIVAGCKNPVFVKITAQGVAAHGSTPWEGIDANEKLMQTWLNIRKIYPSFSKEEPKPDNTWIDTVHFAKIAGGEVSNILSVQAEALLDFRLINTSSVENLRHNLEGCVESGVQFEIVSSSTSVIVSENDPYVQNYKKIAEDVLGKPVTFEYIGGATDSRVFADRGSVLIMHSGSGAGMHAPEEFVDLNSMKELSAIQIKFLEQFSAPK